MKLFQYAIASIVDVNTGNGLPLVTGRAEKAAPERVARPAVSSRIANYLQRLRSAIGVLPTLLRKRREERRSLRQLSELDDRLLADIGLARGDVLAAESGLIDIAELHSRQVRSRGNRRVNLRHETAAVPNTETRSAFNEAVYARAKCA